MIKEFLSLCKAEAENAKAMKTNKKFVTALETFHVSDMKLDDVERRLAEYDMKLKSSSSVGSKQKEKKSETKYKNQQTFAASRTVSGQGSKSKPSKINMKCNFCGRKGHRKSDCFFFKKNKRQQVNIM
ncbi:hypothetical protein JTB14_000238 [Gonioctena quinquepunctata]|nr:hypothetical protein JTB14_000238 [Gonioctena quinquepunctata]